MAGILFVILAFDLRQLQLSHPCQPCQGFMRCKHVLLAQAKSPPPSMLQKWASGVRWTKTPQDRWLTQSLAGLPNAGDVACSYRLSWQDLLAGLLLLCMQGQNCSNLDASRAGRRLRELE